jgi:hypothetical protein
MHAIVPLQQAGKRITEIQIVFDEQEKHRKPTFRTYRFQSFQYEDAGLKKA